MVSMIAEGGRIFTAECSTERNEGLRRTLQVFTTTVEMEKKSIKTEQYYGEPSEVGNEENVLCFLEHTKYLEPRFSYALWQTCGYYR